MFNDEIFALSFARSLELARTGAHTDQQKSGLRAVYALTSVASAMVRVYQDMLSVDDVGIPAELPFVAGLIERMRDHGVAEVAIAKGASPVELLALIRGLAAQPPPEGDVQRIKMRLRDARSTAIMVIPVQREEDEAGRRASSVSLAFDAAALEEATPAAGGAAAAPAPPPGPVAAETPDGQPRFSLPAVMHRVDLGVAPAGGPGIRLEPTRPPIEPAGPARVPPEMLGPYEPEPAEAQAGVISARTALGIALAEVAREPYGEDVLNPLTRLSKLILRALAEDKIEQAVHATAAVIAWEPEAPEGSARNAYAIVILRTLTHDTLTRVAPFISDPRLSSEVTTIMRRGRGDAAEVLLGMLASAKEMRERRALMTVLRGMPSGLTQVMHMLQDSQWFVVRNVAELMGEQRVEEAAPDLIKVLGHSDARVRRAAAIALAKIGTPVTVESLRRVLKEGDREIRAIIAAAISGAKSRALAMPLVAFAEQEPDVDVLREYYRALGRIGTPEALQALARAAEPGGLVLGRRSSGQRVAAVDGLRAAGAQAADTLQRLAKDGDKAVRNAAARALGEIRAREASIGA